MRLHLVALLGLASHSACACDLDPWLQGEAGADRGYHVLCVHQGWAEVHVNGVAEGTADTLKLAVNSSLPDELEASLKIKKYLVFKPTRQPNGQGVWKGGALKWRKQSWALYTSGGERLDLSKVGETLGSYEGVVLLFEGGIWRWPSVRVGHERPVLPGVSLRTVSMRPALFQLVFSESGDRKGSVSNQDRLSIELLNGVTDLAKTRLQRSLTENRVDRVRTSEQTWLSYQATEGIAMLQRQTEKLLHIPASYFEENLQVLRYLKDQFYDAHRDYWDPREFPDPTRFLHPVSKLWMMRHATVLWFLNAGEAGGETWFPRAHGGPIPWNEWTACDSRGEKMSGRNGTIAALFYSLYSNGVIDEYSWHCGCPVAKGVKWAANSWVWNQPRDEVGAKPRITKKKKKSSAQGAEL